MKLQNRKTKVKAMFLLELNIMLFCWRPYLISHKLGNLAQCILLIPP